MTQKSGNWRTLDDIEIALVKGMHLRGLARDYIMSFFVRPARVISPAVVSELNKKRPDVPPASEHDVEIYINKRINEANSTEPYHGFGPTSALRVREVLQITKDAQGALPGFESHFAEFKSTVSSEKAGKAHIARSLAAFANHRGGYVFLGIEDGGKICRIAPSTDLEAFWDELSDVISGHFTPFFRWDRGVVELLGKRVAVAYAFAASDKPVIASADYTSKIQAGQIYFRYNRSTKPIEPGDLLKILHERDRKAAAESAAKTPNRPDNPTPSL